MKDNKYLFLKIISMILIMIATLNIFIHVIPMNYCNKWGGNYTNFGKCYLIAEMDKCVLLDNTIVEKNNPWVYVNPYEINVSRKWQ